LRITALCRSRLRIARRRKYKKAENAEAKGEKEEKAKGRKRQKQKGGKARLAKCSGAEKPPKRQRWTKGSGSRRVEEPAKGKNDQRPKPGMTGDNIASDY